MKDQDIVFTATDSLAANYTEFLILRPDLATISDAGSIYDVCIKIQATHNSLGGFKFSYQRKYNNNIISNQLTSKYFVDGKDIMLHKFLLSDGKAWLDCNGDLHLSGRAIPNCKYRIESDFSVNIEHLEVDKEFSVFANGKISKGGSLNASLQQPNLNAISHSNLQYHFYLYFLEDGTKAIGLSFTDVNGRECTFTGTSKLADDTRLDADKSLCSPLFSNLVQNADSISWQSYGTACSLSFDGKLSMVQGKANYAADFKLVGFACVNLAGQHYKSLDINADKLHLTDDLSTECFKVNARVMHNIKTICCLDADIAATSLINHGKIKAQGASKIKTMRLDNCAGSIEANRGVTITFAGTTAIPGLGAIIGDTVKLINPPSVINDGLIVGRQKVILQKPQQALIMPNVVIDTAQLTLQAADFQLDPKTSCAKTIWQVTPDKNVKLTHDYCTSGSFEIHETGTNNKNIKARMLQRFGEVAKYELEQLPASEYTVAILATVQADNGIAVLTPHAKLGLGDNENNKQGKLLTLGAEIQIYATELDAEYGMLAAVDGFVWVPKGVTIGRLMADLMRRAIATFHAHAHCNSSFSLGSDIQPISYSFLDKETTVYDGIHALNMPVAISNGSHWAINNKLSIIGAIKLYAELASKDLSIQSIGPSLIKAGKIKVEGRCELAGEFNLCRVTTTFKFYYHCNGGPYRSEFNFCNSDAAELIVQGKIFGNCTINRQASNWYFSEKADEVAFSSVDFATSLYQQFISGSPEEFAKLDHPYLTRERRQYSLHNMLETSYFTSALTVSVNNGFNHQNSATMMHVANFLLKTNNFIESQKIFTSNLSSCSSLVLVAHNPRLEGRNRISGSLTLSYTGKLSLLSKERYFMPIAAPISNLMSRSFNPNASYINTQAMQSHFLIRELYWFNEQASREFYAAISEHIIAIGLDGSVCQLKPGARFGLSPKFLIDRVREDCALALQGGLLYEGRPIDGALVQELHRNTTKYLAQTNAASADFAQALIINAKSEFSDEPPEPMIYYKISMTDERLEILMPHLYIPRSWIKQACGYSGDALIAQHLLALPAYYTPQQLLALSAGRPAHQMELQQYFSANPKSQQLLHNNALALQAKQSEHTQLLLAQSEGNKLAVQNFSERLPTSSIEAFGHIEIKGKAILIADGAINIHGLLQAETALLASLLDNVIAESLVGRTHHYDHGSFDDYVMWQARIKVGKVLQIFAGKSVIFVGAETEAGILTEVRALEAIIDMPLTLVHQRVQKYFSENSSGTVTDVVVEPYVSKHKVAASGVGVNLFAEQMVKLIGLYVEAPVLNVEATHGTASVEAAMQQRQHQASHTSNKSGVFGGKTKRSTSMVAVTSDVAAKLKVQQFNIAGKNILLHKLYSTAQLNVLHAPGGEVAILLGRNTMQAASSHSTSDLWWQRSSSQSTTQDTFSSSIFEGKIQIIASQIMLEQVRGKTLDYLKNLEIQQGNLVYSTLDEYIARESKAVEGPGAGLMAIVAIAATIATYGAASSWAAATWGFVEGGVANAVVASGFANICSQAAVSLLANEGNPLKAINALNNSKAVEKLATAMISAGVMAEVSEAMNLPEYNQRQLLDHAKYNIARASVSATINISINGEDLDKALMDGVVDAAISTATAVIVTETGLLTKEDSRRSAATKIALVHTAIGALEGSVTGSDAVMLATLKAVTSGVVGYMADEARAERKHAKNNAVIGFNSGDASEEEEELPSAKKKTKTLQLQAGDLESEDSYQNKATWDVLWSAVTGDSTAKLEMRNRWPNGAYFFDNHDPYLTRNDNDGEFMAEAKMYGRSAKNARDATIYTVTKPHLVVRDGFRFGADTIEAGLHYYVGTNYKPASQARNNTRMDAAVKLWNADPLTQREALLSFGATSMLFGASRNLGLVEAGVNSAMNVVGATRSFVTTHDFSSPLIFRSDKFFNSLGSNRLGSMGANGFEALFNAIETRNPFDSATKCSFTKRMTAKLNKQGYQDHHIVSNKNKGTKSIVSEVFELAGIDINDSRLNRIFLPTRDGIHPTRSTHNGRHLQVVNESLELKLKDIKDLGSIEGWNQVQYNQAVVSVIQREKGLLKSGERALNKNKTRRARSQSPTRRG